MTAWKKELDKIPYCLQRQDSLNAQLEDAIEILNRFGFHDASDFIDNYLRKNGNWRYLAKYGDSKIIAIKACYNQETGIGLREAKEKVEEYIEAINNEHKEK